jgi:phosphoglycerol transferase MdoB-like AlkP superfamily enzyme
MQATLPAPMTASDPAGDVRPAAERLGWLLLFVMLSAALVAAFESRSYSRAILQLNALDLCWSDQALVFWSVWSKSLVLLVPVLAAATLTVRKPRLTAFVALTGSVAILGWLALDTRLQHMTGCHVADYLDNVFNVRAWQWGGDMGQILYKLSLCFVCAVIVVLLVYVIVCKLAPRWIRLVPERSYRRLGAIATAYVVLMVGVLPARQAIREPLALERLYASLPSSALFFEPESVPGGGATAFGQNCDHDFVSQATLLHALATNPAPIDRAAKVSAQGPHVVVLIVESFRHMSFDAEYMPKMAAWCQQGLWLKQHYANANRSEFGTFALLYGRYPLAFHAALDAKVAPQFSQTFRQSGYRCLAITSCIFDYIGMNQFISAAHYDELELQETGTWPERDRRTLRRIADVVNASAQPCFVLSYLMSTHFTYYCPPEYEQGANQIDGKVARTTLRREDLEARYRNSLAFMDDELDGFLRSVDMTRTMVVITGDHAESFHEDGCVTHGSRLSEIQTHVPMLIVGGGAPAKAVDAITGHVDVMPTVLSLLGGSRPRGCHGRDVLADTGPGQTLLVHNIRDSWDLMLVHGDGWLKMNLRRDQPVLRLLGFCDKTGKVQSRLRHDVDERPRWQAALDALGK